MIDLAIADAPGLVWPEHCSVSPRIRKEIEAQWAEQQQHRQQAQALPEVGRLRDEVRQLRAEMAQLKRHARRAAMMLGGTTAKDLRGHGIDIPAKVPDRAKIRGLADLTLALSQQIGAGLVLCFCGDWTVSRAYTPGSLVVHDGEAWVAQQESKGMEPNHGVVWFRMPGGIYHRGVWEPEVRYHAGDAVMQSGSSFVAKTATAGEKPGEGEGSAWRMLSKRGRDSRDRTQPQRDPVVR